MINGNTKQQYDQAGNKSREFEIANRIAKAFGLPVKEVLKASGINQNVSTKKVIHQFEYHIELDGKRYTVISRRDITKNEPTKFSSEYFDHQNNIVHDDRITNALHQEVMNIVRRHHEQKACSSHGQGKKWDTPSAEGFKVYRGK